MRRLAVSVVVVRGDDLHHLSGDSRLDFVWAGTATGMGDRKHASSRGPVAVKDGIVCPRVAHNDHGITDTITARHLREAERLWWRWGTSLSVKG